jgi:Uma2 family endonuclease
VRGDTVSGQFGDAYRRRKVPEYLEAGAKVVWLLDPRNRTVRAFEAGSSEVIIYSGDEEITLDRIAPGFRAPISSFFPD